jgi:hypothetical protein
MYLFDIQELKPFDILLVRFPGDENSEKIQDICQSKYSHAVVYLGDNVFVEGVMPIVTLFSGHRYYFESLEDIQVIRLKPDYAATFNSVKAEAGLRSLAYCNYSSMLLARIDKRQINPQTINLFQNSGRWTGGIVCSTMVSLPYYAGGIDLSGNDEPYYVHFGHIENGGFFDTVTSEVMTEDPDFIPGPKAFNYMNGEETGSIQEKNSEAALTLNKTVQNIFAELSTEGHKYPEIRIEPDDLIFSTWEDIEPLITRWFLTKKGKEIDEKIYQTIISTGYNQLWIEEMHGNHAMYFPVLNFVEDVKAGLPIHPDVHYSFNSKSFDNYLNKLGMDYDAAQGNFDRCPSKTNHVLVDMYRSYKEAIFRTKMEYEFVAENYYDIINEVAKSKKLF